MNNDPAFMRLINSHIYLNAKYRHTAPANKFPEDVIRVLKIFFFDIWKKNIRQRSNNIQTGDKEKLLLKYCFEWTICSPDFKGNLTKGLMLVSNQGFGKDVILKTIVEFYDYFHFKIKEYNYPNFCTDWFENRPERFAVPLKITDITEMGRMKRERESIPFLELLDYRESNFLMRGLLVSSNYKPDVLQDILEGDKIVKRLHERIKECFNVVLITDSESKRVENLEII